jgi:hypothetical protein
VNGIPAYLAVEVIVVISLLAGIAVAIMGVLG